MSIFEHIKSDREAGTRTPWRMSTVKTSCGVCHKIGPFKYNNGKETDACVYEDYPWTTPSKMSEPEANARRIARVPQLERIALAAEALLNSIEVGFDEHGGWLPNEAIDALREACE
ncbi:hypothetical protein [Phaeobacter sp. Ay1a-4a]|uniref:hypothetical protein n=1 Tax=Phaeobacter sp. Ay1a-4a TaxID=3112439 RepID=UPI003A83BDD8